jgi:hypothetical protein
VIGYGRATWARGRDRLLETRFTRRRAFELWSDVLDAVA